MIIRIYRKDQGAHTTMWKEHSVNNEDDGYEVKFEGGIIWLIKSNSPIDENSNPEKETIFVGGGENFYFTRSEK